jgi:hypothetical protein
MKQTLTITVANMMVLKLLQDLASLKLISFDDAEPAEDDWTPPPEWPGLTRNGARELARYAQECDEYWAQGGKGLSVEETVAHAYSAIEAAREKKNAA